MTVPVDTAVTYEFASVWFRNKEVRGCLHCGALVMDEPRLHAFWHYAQPDHGKTAELKGMTVSLTPYSERTLVTIAMVDGTMREVI